MRQGKGGQEARIKKVVRGGPFCRCIWKNEKSLPAVLKGEKERWKVEKGGREEDTREN